MKTNRKATLAITTLAAGTLIYAPAAFADPVASSVIAQDPTPAPTVAPDATVIGVDANIVGGLTVTGAAGKPVTVTAKGQAPRMATAGPGAPVVFRKLSTGVPYAVAIAGRTIGIATPLAAPGAAFGLTVSTTTTPGSVQLDWQHQTARSEGKVSYTITATPTGTQLRTAAEVAPVRAIANVTSATLTGLNPDTLYTFTVTPTNTAATGQASSATMTRTLADLSAANKPAAVAIPLPKAADPAPAPAPASAPTPAGPTTRTIYVCPTGFTDAGSLCNKTQTYTFHSVTTTSPYSYHQQFVQTGSHTDYSASPNGGTYYAQDAWNGNDGSPAGYYAVIPDGYYATVKDAPPTGYTDNGSAYSKTELVKDTAPVGYSDNGTAWITTAAKVAQEVPA
ncbi:MAG: fibronectin type III domain-containing protein [Actinomycetota bacterium]|nr:fibronectin type III domain-containing protein [Actinomycetota bacterium]